MSAIAKSIEEGGRSLCTGLLLSAIGAGAPSLSSFIWNGTFNSLTYQGISPGVSGFISGYLSSIVLPKRRPLREGLLGVASGLSIYATGRVFRHLKNRRAGTKLAVAMQAP